MCSVTSPEILFSMQPLRSESTERFRMGQRGAGVIKAVLSECSRNFFSCHIHARVGALHRLLRSHSGSSHLIRFHCVHPYDRARRGDTVIIQGQPQGGPPPEKQARNDAWHQYRAMLSLS